MKNKAIGYWILALSFALIVGLGFFTNAFSIASIVNEQGSNPSVSSAFSDCRVSRGELINKGLDCEQCALVASSGKVERQANGLYTFDYGGATRYSGEWSDLRVDYIGGVKTSISSHETTNAGFYKTTLLEVKSFCQDSIRVCQVQDGEATIIETYPSANQEIQKLSVAYGYNDCTTDEIQSVTAYEIFYKVVCVDSDFYVDGLKISENINELGQCVRAGESIREGQAGSFKSVSVDDEVKVNSQVHATGVFVAETGGSYLISASLRDESLTPLSVVTGFSASDPCGRGVDSASKYFTLEAGDSAVFDLVFQSPNEAGDYEVIIEAVDNCQALNTFDYQLRDMRVLADDAFKEVVINKVITEEPDFYEEYVKGLREGLEGVASEGCEDGDVEVEGCVVARCVDGELFSLDEIVCDDGTNVNTNDVYGSLETPTGFATGKLLSFEKGGLGVFSVVIIVLLVVAIIIGIYYVRGKKK